MADIATLGLRVDATGAIQATDKLTASLKSTGDSAVKAEAQLSKVTSTLKLLGAAFSAAKIVEATKDAALLAARYETLGVVMNTVGANAGKTSAQMKVFQEQLEDTGISMIAARENLARLASANIDLGRSAEIARIAQNAAVIAGLSSAEAFDKLVAAISTGNTRMLRTLGIYVDINDGLQKYADTLGKAKNDLTGFERIQANLNTVVEGAAPIVGVYAASMETAGKQLTSLTRYVENAKVKVGEAFQPQVIALVRSYGDALKFVSENAVLVTSTIRGLAGVLSARLFAGVIGSAREYVASITATRTATIAALQDDAKAAFARVAASERKVAAMQKELAVGVALKASAAELAAFEAKLAIERGVLTAATDASTAAEARLAVALRVTTGAMATTRTAAAGLVAALGGIPGVILTGLAVAWTVLTAVQEKARRAHEDARDEFQKGLADNSIEQLQKKYDSLLLTIAKVEQAREKAASAGKTPIFVPAGAGAPIVTSSEDTAREKELLDLREQLASIEKELTEKRTAAAKAAEDQATAEADAYRKASADAVEALERQRALNTVMKLGDTDRERRTAAINAEYDLKTKLRKIDEEYTGAQAAALKALAIALSRAETAQRKYNEAREDQEKIDATVQSKAEYRKQALESETKALQKVQEALAALRNRRDEGARAADKDIEGVQRQINLFGKTGKEAKKLSDEYLFLDKQAEYVAAGLDAVNATLKAQEFVKKQNELDRLVKTTTDWANVLQGINNTLRNLGESLGGSAQSTVKYIATITNALELLIRAQKQAKATSVDRAGKSASGTEKLVGALGVAGGGFAAGSAFGSTTSSKTVGALGGALSGAAAGALAGSVLPGIGTLVGGIIGGLTGAIGGLLSASKNATQELIAQKAAQKNLNEALTAMRATFSNDALGQAIAQAKIQFETLRKDTEAAFSGKKNEAERNKILAELNVLEAKRIQILKDEFAAQQTSIQQSAKVRELAAQGRTAEAQALQQKLADEKEINDLVKAGATEASIAAVQAAQLAEAEKRLRDEREQQRRTIFDLTNSAQAFTDPRGAEDARLVEENNRRVFDAIKAGATEAELAAIRFYNAAVLANREAEKREADQRTRESLVVRGLTALGDTRGAQDKALQAEQRQELADAVKAGMSDANMALLRFVQFSEREALATRRAIEDGTKAINERANNEVAAIDLLIETTRNVAKQQIAALNEQIAAAQSQAKAIAKAFDAQIADVRAQSKLQLDAVDAQIAAAREALDVQKSQLATLEKSVEVSQKVFESLNQYLDSVQLGDLSTLSPEAKLAEARRQFDTMAQQAQTGDATAAQGLPQAANALLQASRAFNASSPAFVEDFNRVATVIQAVRDQFGKSLPVDVQTLEAVRRQVATAEQSIEVLQRQKEVIQRTAEEQVALLQKAKDEAAEQSAQLIERLTNQRDAIQEASDKQLAKLEESRQAVLDSAQRQIDQLIADENAKLQTRLRENEFYTQFQQYTLESSTYFANIIEELQAQTGAMNGSFGGSTGTGDTAQSTSPVQVALEANVTELKEANRVLKEELTELRVRLDKLITVSVAASGEEVAATRQVERAVGVLATETRNAAQAAATRIPVRR